MGKKKKRAAAEKRWCYYCEREFDDEKILIQHQKAKHFKCHVCHKKLSTAAGMVIHVLQVHKESVTKVPNAKVDRDSTDIEIFGMQGIPPDVLAAHYGEEEDNTPSKSAKVVSPPIIPGPPRPPFGIMQPLYNSAYAVPPAGWAVPPRPQPWYPPHPAASLPPPLGPVQQQPLFPVQNIRPAMPANGLPPATSVSVSQPLFPVVASNNMPPQSSTFSASVVQTSYQLTSPVELKSSVDACKNASAAMNYVTPPLQGGTLYNPYSYASAPNTNGPLIGPPPMIANKVPSSQLAMHEEERRTTLPKYQVHDETSQMSSIDAAIDKRILESRLAGRMAL